MFNNNVSLISSYLATGSGPVVSYTAPVVADYEEMVATVAVGNQVTTDRTFNSGDVGKLIIIKEGRDYPAYREAPITYTGIIDSVALGVATISSSLGHTLLTGIKNIYIGTNNFDIIQNAINYCDANSIGVLRLNYNGTALVNVQLSAIGPTQYHLAGTQHRGLLVQGFDLKIKGNGIGVTSLKWAAEDIMNHLSTEYVYAGFTFGASNFEIEDLEITAPDRSTTRTNSDIVAVRSIVATLDERSCTLRNVNIFGERDNGWYSGFYNARGGNVGYRCNFNFINSDITARLPITIFSQDGAYITYYVRGLNITGGGSKEYRPTYLACANITSGSTTLVIEDPTFSWYDFNSYVNANPTFTINGSFNAEVIAIIDYKTATINTPAPSTFTSADIFVKGRGSAAEGHAHYIHPNVDQDIDGLTLTKCVKLGMHQHSGGGVPGVSTVQNYKNIVVDTTPADIYTPLTGFTFNAAWEMDAANSGVPYTIENCDIYFYSNYELPVIMDNTYIRGGQIGGGTITNCTGTLDTRSSYTVTIDNQKSGYISSRDLTGGVKDIVITNSGTSDKVGIDLWGGKNISITDTLTKGIIIYDGFRGATGSIYTFTNVDIRGYPGGPFTFFNAGFTSWTNPEIEQFLTQATFTGCTISATGHAALPSPLRPVGNPYLYFTIA